MSETKHILLIDDEPDVRTVLKKILEKLGNTVNDFDNPIDAVEMYKTQFQVFDIVIFDFMMPEINGEDLFYKLKDINEELKSVVISGYNDQKIKQLRDDGCLAFLEKPIDLIKLKECLDYVAKCP